MKTNTAQKKPRGGRNKKSDSEDTRRALLDAARREFAAGGLEGARVDRIAASAGVNKQLVYHYFGSKDDLYGAVLMQAYQGIRDRERDLDLAGLPPLEAMRVLVEFSFDYLDENREFVALITDENSHQGRHVKESEAVEPINRPIIELIRETLTRGADDGVFKQGLDPLQVYVSIAGLSFFYFSNAHTLSRIFGRDLLDAGAVAERRAHVVDFALDALTP
ncbi:TetR/AcrR family transcriptional regulator [Maritimibacter fusiformis]|uniref:TetR/AcrR family transcriptional regulator n=1 Tax=Maritimibacter fusiformis TaxID=2603819 RepID=A0A5D0RRV1_9RHOB|nr:TetR/AcrR family transcriptional regulator [Maritimibacter fusiformis]TYB83314.1 TetR/AcrR family transcriptional regulator [Maritimibacter fusiformis]